MPLTRFKLSAIGDGGITTAKLADDSVTTAKIDDTSGGATAPGTEFYKVPAGTTAQRPSVGAAGQIRFNTDNGVIEQWNTNTNSWVSVASPPVLTSVSYGGSITAADPAGGETLTLTGTGFLSGAIVKINDVELTTTFVSATSLTFTTQALSAGDYDVVVVNGNGLTATLTNGISFNGTPSFTSPAAGSIASVDGGDAISTITIVASETDGGAITYSITTGSLPSGLSLNGTNGQITGTASSVSSDTTTPFTITATDDEGQTSTRNYSIQVLAGIYAYDIANSLRFDSYGEVTAGRLITAQSTPTSTTAFTISCWVKRTDDITSGYKAVLTSENGNQSNDGFFFKNGNIPSFSYGYYPTTGNGLEVYTNASVEGEDRDRTAWKHYVWAFDTTQSSGSRAKLYVNGVQHTLTNEPNLNQASGISTGGLKHLIGVWHDGGTYNYKADMYLADVYFIDGQQLQASDFGETKRGVWQPKQYTGTFGDNGYHLTFDDNTSVTTLLEDSSGNSNGFESLVNVQTTNQTIDSPTHNYCNLNPFTSQGSVSCQNGGTKVNISGKGGVKGSMSVARALGGKWYYEVEPLNFSSGGIELGWVSSHEDIDTANDGDIYSLDGLSIRARTSGSYYSYTGLGSTPSLGSDFSVNDTIGVGLDFDNSEFKIWKNGTLVSTVDISSWWSNIGNDANRRFCPAIASSTAANSGMECNVRFHDVQETVPAGFKLLTVQNLTYEVDDPTNHVSHKAGEEEEDFFKVVEYTGNGTSDGTSQFVSTGFTPDFVIIKDRDTANTLWWAHDVIMSTNGGLYPGASNTPITGSEGYGSLLDLESGGFRVYRNDTYSITSHNRNGAEHSAYCWKAGGTGVTNNDGTTTSTVSANQKSGFSIVHYSGDGTTSNAIGHGLGKKPSVIWTKSSNTYNWDCWIDGIVGSGERWSISNTSGGVQSTQANQWGTINDSVFTVGASSYNNNASLDYYAYCWADTEGVFQSGTFTGNGEEYNGIWFDVGLKPALLLIWATGGGDVWIIDKTFNYNGNSTNVFLRLNSNGTRLGNEKWDFNANGFASRYAGSSSTNNDGTQYFYMAWSEQAFKYAVGVTK